MEEIIEFLHKKYNIPKVAMRAICESPFVFTASTMSNHEMETVNMIGLGKFACHPNRKKYLIENNLVTPGRNDIKRKAAESESETHSAGLGESDIQQ